MARGGAWKRMGRLNGSDAGRRAKPVWICRGCGAWHDDAKPAQCIGCGRMDFDHFHSTGEATYWARLKLRERAGDISDLQRQVPLALMTIGREGLPCKWGELTVDYAFKDEDGAQRYFDWKPVAGVSPDAVLKIRCLEAQGIKVELVTAKGVV